MLSLIYNAPNSIHKRGNGHAYASAHILLHLSLAATISKERVIVDDVDANIQETFEDVKHSTISFSGIENCDEKAEAWLYQFNQKLTQYERRGSAAKLWMKCFHIHVYAKELMRTESMGYGFQAHSNCAK